MILATLWPVALLAASVQDLPSWAGRQLAQATVTVRRTLIIRVPATPIPAAIRWKTKKGPKCVVLRDIGGAIVSGPDRVDMIFRGGLRVRAELENACPAIDYYGGFYLRPGPDGRVCADRDPIRARSGGECQIERFRLLVPVAVKP